MRRYPLEADAAYKKLRDLYGEGVKKMAGLDEKLEAIGDDVKRRAVEFWNDSLRFVNSAALIITGAISTFSAVLEPKWAGVVALVSGLVLLVQKKVVSLIKK